MLSLAQNDQLDDLLDHSRLSPLIPSIQQKTEIRQIPITREMTESNIEMSRLTESKSLVINSTLRPESVRNIALRLGFPTDVIEKWKGSLHIPIGVSPDDWVLRKVVGELRIDPAIQLTELWRDHRAILEDAMRLTPIPDVVTEKPQRIAPSALIGPEASVHSSFRPEIDVYKTNLPKKNRTDGNQILESLRNKKGFGLPGKCFYRGMGVMLLLRQLYDGLYAVIENEPNDFGAGIYTTPSIDYAIQYAGRNGVVLVFDWTDIGDDLAIKHLQGDEWQRTLKGNLCFPRHHPPSHEGSDVLFGPVSVNPDAIKRCAPPVPDACILQVVGKTPRADNSFAQRLVAAVFLS